MYIYMRKYITYLFLFIGLMGFSQVEYHFADLLIWKNDTTEIYSYPMCPQNEIKIQKLFIAKGIIQGRSFMSCKYYKAEWKILEDKLYLSNIYSGNYYQDNFKVNIDSLFSGNKNGLIFADWYTGNIFVPEGSYIHVGGSHGSNIHESEWKISIKNGVILKEELKQENYYESIYTKNPDSLRNFITMQIDWSQIPVLETEKEKVHASIKTGEGKNGFTIDVRSNNEKISQEITRVLQTLPEFNYYYFHGRYVALRYSLRLTFTESMRPK